MGVSLWFGPCNDTLFVLQARQSARISQRAMRGIRP